MTKQEPPDDPAPVRESDDEPYEEQAVTVTLLPEPDVPDPGEVDPADSYREGVDRDGEAGDRTPQ